MTEQLRCEKHCTVSIRNCAHILLVVCGFCVMNFSCTPAQFSELPDERCTTFGSADTVVVIVDGPRRCDITAEFRERLVEAVAVGGATIICLNNADANQKLFAKSESCVFVDVGCQKYINDYTSSSTLWGVPIWQGGTYSLADGRVLSVTSLIRIRGKTVYQRSDRDCHNAPAPPGYLVDRANIDTNACCSPAGMAEATTWNLAVKQLRNPLVRSFGPRALVPFLKLNDFWTCWNTAWYMEEFLDSSVVDPLLLAGKQGQLLTKKVALYLLGRIGDCRSVPWMIECLSDQESELISEEAAEALYRVSGQRFGTDAVQWEQWFRNNCIADSAAKPR
jgi:hypothetical protein